MEEGLARLNFLLHTGKINCYNLYIMRGELISIFHLDF